MNTGKQISVFIVDDERLARDRLKRLIDKADGYSVLGEAENGEIAISLIPELNPDIVLLDIRMPGKDGLSVAEFLFDLEQTPAIIFCTAYDDYAISAFKYNAIGYLLKPVRQDELNQALNNAQKLNQLQIKQAKQSLTSQDEEAQIFVANTWQGKELIEFDSIYFFRSDHKYLTVVHANGEALSDQTLKDLEQSYPDQLIRVHRNTLINKAHINSLLKKHDGHYEIQIKNSTHCISVSRRHVSDIKSYLASLL